MAWIRKSANQGSELYLANESQLHHWIA